jgi:very-short-patch-repair endonuclease
MVIELNDILFKKGKLVASRCTERYFNNKLDIKSKILEYTKDFDIPFKERIYLSMNGLDKKGVCYCGNYTNLKTVGHGYFNYCSIKCSENNEEKRRKTEQTNLKKFGTKSPAESKIVKEKIVKTNLNKYGVKMTLMDKEVNDKARKTMVKKYGAEYTLSKGSSLIDRVSKTNIEKYGTETPLESENVLNKTRKTLKERYGVEHGLSHPEIYKRTIENMKIKYGVDNPMKLEEIKNKVQRTKRKKLLSKYEKVGIVNLVDNLDDTFTVRNYCDKHSEFVISHHNLGQRVFRYKLDSRKICSICNKEETSSSIEYKITDILDKYNINYVKNNRKLLEGKEIDIYIPEAKLAIEINGTYWHSDVYKDDEYHMRKTNLCNSKGVDLFHIWGDQIEFNQNIIESMLLNKLKLTPNKIYARNCEIREIDDNSLVKNFLNKNHIQGFVPSKIKIGLFYNGELVSIMTFGNLRRSLGSKNKEGSFELLRFCNKVYFNVLGGASKLFNHFKNQYDFKEVLSYASRDYSNGELYSILGFDYIGKTKPNYHYIINNMRQNRYKYRKDILINEGFDPELTEREIMSSLGYLRIYDSGSYKYNYTHKK